MINQSPSPQSSFVFLSMFMNVTMPIGTNSICISELVVGNMRYANIQNRQKLLTILDIVSQNARPD